MSTTPSALPEDISVQQQERMTTEESHASTKDYDWDYEHKHGKCRDNRISHMKTPKRTDTIKCWT
jgi:hypothetical protein